MKEKLFIKRFIIKNLFGLYDVDIPFKSNINIFVGENGLGKTTILNALNYIIQGDGDSLATIMFDRILLTLGNDKTIEIVYEKLLDDNSSFNKKYTRHSHYLLDEHEDTLVRKIAIDYLKEKSDYAKLDSKTIKETILDKYKDFISPFALERLYNVAISDNTLIKKLEDSWEMEIFNYMKSYSKVIYLPTYRRIEEDFNSFIEHNKEYIRLNRKKNSFSSLQFGMDDVQNSIDKTCYTLKNNTNEGFKEMTSNLLTNYLKISDNKYNNCILNKTDIQNLDIVFSRLADKIDLQVKSKIINLLKENKSKNDQYHQYLISIINELNNIYEKNKQIDDNLDSFMKVCNHYLVNKEVLYDKFKIECIVLEKKTKRTISLKDLSSGEKQLLSLFSKLYLNDSEKNIILFDEPELSLSIIWQSKLVPDIINSKKCSFLTIITHSPFIFDNNYRVNTRDITNYIKINKG